MSNEEKILEILERMDARLSRVEETQAMQGKKLDEIDKRSERTAVLMESKVVPQVQLLYEGHALLRETLASNERVEKIEDTIAEKVVVLESVVKSHSERIAKLEKAI